MFGPIRRGARSAGASKYAHEARWIRLDGIEPTRLRYAATIGLSYVAEPRHTVTPTRPDMTLLLEQGCHGDSRSRRLDRPPLAVDESPSS